MTREAYYRQLQSEEQDMLGSTTPVRAHMDGGSMANTTDRRELLWNFKEKPGCTLRVADDHPHYPTGTGFVRVPSDDACGYREIRCYYTPTLPATILSPASMCKQFQCSSYSSLTHFGDGTSSVSLHHCKRISQNVVFPLIPVRGLLYTSPLIPVPPSAPISVPATVAAIWSDLDMHGMLVDCDCTVEIGLL